MPRGHVLANGRKVALLRGEADLTQAEMAELAGFGLRTIGKLETGHPTTAMTLSAVAIVLTRKLKRPISFRDLLLQPTEPNQTANKLDPDFLIAEQIKVLDLRRWRPDGEHPAVLVDHHRFRRLPQEGSPIVFRYSTTGTALRGRCLSHPDRFEWFPVTPNGHSPRLNLSCELRLRLPAESGSAGCDIQNAVEYLDGFTGNPREWFHTVITYPTESLTFLVLFPQEKTFHRLHGLCQRASSDFFQLLPQQPIGLQGGHLACWRIREPQVGETYRLEWEW